MKKKNFLAAVLLVFGLCALFAQRNPSITITNNTGHIVYYVYITEAGESSRGQDQLGDAVLMNNTSKPFTLPYRTREVNRYNIILRDEDNREYIKRNVLVREDMNITFTRDDIDRGDSSRDDRIDPRQNPSSNGPQITIINNTRETIINVFISQTAAEDWGMNRLDRNQNIRSGQSREFTLPYPLNVVNRYDIRIEDADGNTYIKMDERVEADRRIEFDRSDLDRGRR